MRELLLIISMIMIVYQSDILKTYSSYTYLNPLIWCGWFSIGAILKNKKIDVDFVFRYRCVWYITYPVIVIYSSYKNSVIEYWSSGTIIIELTAIFMIMNLAKYRSRFLEYIGKRTFLIYLLHMPIAGIVSNIMNRFAVTAVITILRPIFVLFLTLIGIYTLEHLIMKTKNRAIKVVTGVNYLG